MPRDRSFQCISWSLGTNTRIRFLALRVSQALPEGRRKIGGVDASFFLGTAVVVVDGDDEANGWVLWPRERKRHCGRLAFVGNCDMLAIGPTSELVCDHMLEFCRPGSIAAAGAGTRARQQIELPCLFDD